MMTKRRKAYIFLAIITPMIVLYKLFGTGGAFLSGVLARITGVRHV